MVETTLNKPATWFWVVAIIGFIWNLMGVMAYLTQVYMGPEVIAAMPEAEQELYQHIPAWVTGAFAIAVFGGTLGCIVLLFRRSMAIPLLIVSVLAVMVQMSYSIFMTRFIAIKGIAGLFMPIMVLLIGLFLVWFSRYSKARNWIG